MADIYSMSLEELWEEKKVVAAALRRIMGLINQKQQALVEDKLGRLVHEFYVSPWSCKRSPIAQCAHDSEADPSHDHCLFCNQSVESVERK